MDTFFNLSVFVQALIATLILTFASPILGIILDRLREYALAVLASKTNPFFALLFGNYLTFPGTMHHELAHALFAFITGAKIHEIALFKPQGTSLGHVSFSTRGNRFLQGIQQVFASSAPVFCGAITCSLIAYALVSFSLPTALVVLLGYLLISIFLHMTMSPADWLIFFKGIIYAFPVVYVVSLIALIFVNR